MNRSGQTFRLLAGLACMAALLFAAGCSSAHGGRVELEPHEGGMVEQEFAQGFITQGRAGEFDVILVNNATSWDYKPEAGKRPLQPTPLAPLRQVMHIHLYWKPLAGTTKNPAAINAAIDWYVLGPDGSADILVYEGAGLVSIGGGGSERSITIRDGKLEPKLRRGDIHDPVGQTRIWGYATARVNETRVKETVEEMRRQSGNGQQAVAQ
jgi:hypothetical protein